MGQWRKKKVYNRIVKRFALLPISVDYTTVWLETVYLVQKNDLRWLLGWYNIRFATKEEYDKFKATGEMKLLSVEQKELLNLLF